MATDLDSPDDKTCRVLRDDVEGRVFRNFAHTARRKIDYYREKRISKKYCEEDGGFICLQVLNYRN